MDYEHQDFPPSQSDFLGDASTWPDGESWCFTDHAGASYVDTTEGFVDWSALGDDFFNDKIDTSSHVVDDALGPTTAAHPPSVFSTEAPFKLDAGSMTAQSSADFEIYQPFGSHSLSYQRLEGKLLDLRKNSRATTFITQFLPLEKRQDMHRLAETDGLAHLSIGHGKCKRILFAKRNIDAPAITELGRSALSGCSTGILEPRVLRLKAVTPSSPYLITPLSSICSPLQGSSDLSVHAALSSWPPRSYNQAALLRLVRRTNTEAIKAGRLVFGAIIVALFRQAESDHKLGILLHGFLAQGPGATLTDDLLSYAVGAVTQSLTRGLSVDTPTQSSLSPAEVSEALINAGLPIPDRIVHSELASGEILLIFHDMEEAAQVAFAAQEDQAWMRTAAGYVTCEYQHFANPQALADFRAKYTMMAQPAPTESEASSRSLSPVADCHTPGLIAPSVDEPDLTSCAAPPGTPEDEDSGQTSQRKRSIAGPSTKRNRCKKYSCPLCNKIFYYPKDVKRHLKTVHKDDRHHNAIT